MAQPGEANNGGHERIFGGDWSDGFWHDAVGVYDGTSLSLYVDGNLVAHKAQWEYDSFSPANIRIGYYVPGDDDNKFIGDIGEVKIYSGAVPEPSAIVLLAIGAISLFAYAWRKRNCLSVLSLPGRQVARNFGRGREMGKLVLIVSLVVSWTCAANVRQVSADVILPNLPSGSEYELVFVTSGGTSSTSSNIDDYNTFVTQQAALSSSLPTGLTWRAVGSTATVNAIDNAPHGTTFPFTIHTGS